MSSTLPGVFLSLIAAAAVVSAALVAVFVVAKVVWGVGIALGGVFTGVGKLVLHVGGTLQSWVTDCLRVIGGTLTGVTYIPMALGQVALGRWSGAKHFGKAMRGEFGLAALSLYKVGLSHPLRLVGLGSLLDGFERRLPEVVLYAPGADTPKEGKDSFEGWKVTGSLPAGGSGGKLFLAEPKPEKIEQLARTKVTAPAKAVIKSFSLASGSTLPQIVRESRALESAKKLGLVVEHVLTPNRFHYVMPFVPGEDLSKVSTALHARANKDGLRDAGVRAAIGYGAGLCEILSRFHAAGLWHKDIKPSNILVCGDRVELVDLGLVTPLGSAMTLTTHGTEYYRDPEMVRLALQGVKVHEVDGVKFDLYSTGAVLYSLIEGSFPAQGNLSSFTKRCPDALRWVIRRAMADVNQRYGSADDMLADLRVLAHASDPFGVKPAELPSMGGREPLRRSAPIPAEFAARAEDPLPELSDASLDGGSPPPLPLHRLQGRELRDHVRQAAREAARQTRDRARQAGRTASREARIAARRAADQAREAVQLANSRAREHAQAARVASEEWHVKRRMEKDKARRSRRHGAVGFLALFGLGFVWMVGYSAHQAQKRGYVSSHQLSAAPSPLPGQRALAVSTPAPSDQIRAQHERTIRSLTRTSNSQRVPEGRILRRAPRVLLLPERPFVGGVDAERQLVRQIEQNFGWQVLSETGERSLNRDQVEILAKARSAASLNSIDDSETQVRLQRLLAGEQEVDAIFWFGMDGDERFEAQILEPLTNEVPSALEVHWFDGSDLHAPVSFERVEGFLNRLERDARFQEGLFPGGFEFEIHTTDEDCWSEGEFWCDDEAGGDIWGEEPGCGEPASPCAPEPPCSEQATMARFTSSR